MQRWAVGNWKMNGANAQIEAYVPGLLAGLPSGWQERGLRVGLCPPYPYLQLMGARLAGSGVLLGAQQSHAVASGAYTGEVSPAMLHECGVDLCIVGHSERRQYFGESNSAVAQQLHGLLEAEIAPILCVGESLAQREADAHQSVIRTQLLEAFRASNTGQMTRRHGEIVHLTHPDFSAGMARRLIVAYEPVWAIGTGQTATPEQANEMHAFIRELLGEAFGAQVAADVPILYGGSVNPGNVEDLMAQPDINGTLVGGASLQPESFLPIIEHSLN